MQGQHDTAGANSHFPGCGCERSAEHRRIGENSAEVMEMPLRYPHCGKVVVVGKLGSFKQQLVFVVAVFPFIAGKIEKTELHGLGEERPSFSFWRSWRT